MNSSGGSMFAETTQLTQVWIKELAEELGWDDRHRAYLALRVTLHALRDHVSVEAAAKFAAQLPMLVRGFYYEGWHPAHKPVRQKSAVSFLTAIENGMRTSPTDDPVDPLAVASAVFDLLDHHLTEGAAEHLRQSLPKQLRNLWPTAYEVSPNVARL